MYRLYIRIYIYIKYTHLICPLCPSVRMRNRFVAMVSNINNHTSLLERLLIVDLTINNYCFTYINHIQGEKRTIKNTYKNGEFSVLAECDTPKFV